MPQSGYLTETPEGIRVNVRAQPRSSRAGLDSIMGDALKVRMRSAPVDGKANKELIEILADVFGIPKSRILFKSGATAKTKQLLLQGLTLEEAKKRVSEKIGQ